MRTYTREQVLRPIKTRTDTFGQAGRVRYGTSTSRPEPTTAYVAMLCEYEKTPLRYNLAASALSWLLLAGYLVFPSTFASLRKSTMLDQAGTIAHSVDNLGRDVPLAVFASLFCLSSTLGLLWLWWKRRNYLWVQRRILLPILMNSAMGLMSTLLNVFTIQDGHWSVTAKINTGVTAGWLLISSFLYILVDNQGA
ncbi:hypothetical protein HIM_10021 [Hirsutella minnesotensis 3608]|uniref:Uncharacterized protein n=1 Tax=Hirsutella minnesotensis 3608 TaxID=1043627 RepID=A0A0F7ZXE7_9HYPO|nr:hypothetical protein HIM_10021 [Hirsutella minnesotensis 3608]